MAAFSLTVAIEGKAQTIEGSDLLVATGRVPNTAALKPAAGGIEIDQRGFIRANDRLETSAPGVYVIGDVKGGPQFTHISYDDFRILKANLLDGGEPHGTRPAGSLHRLHGSAAGPGRDDGERSEKERAQNPRSQDADDLGGAGPGSRRNAAA